MHVGEQAGGRAGGRSGQERTGYQPTTPWRAPTARPAVPYLSCGIWQNSLRVMILPPYSTWVSRLWPWKRQLRRAPFQLAVPLCLRDTAAQVSCNTAGDSPPRGVKEHSWGQQKNLPSSPYSPASPMEQTPMVPRVPHLVAEKQRMAVVWLADDVVGNGQKEPQSTHRVREKIHFPATKGKGWVNM